MREKHPRMAWIHSVVGVRREGVPIAVAGSTALRHRVAGGKP